MSSHGGQVVGDDIGTLHNTVVTCTFDTCVEYRSPELGPDGPAPVQWDALDVAVERLNVVIEHYRIVEHLHGIRRVASRNVRAFLQASQDAAGPGGTSRPTYGPVYAPVGLHPAGEDAGVQPAPPEKVKELQRRVDSGQLVLERVLYSDAEAEILTGNVRSGLTHLYVAFEMMVWSQHERLGRAVAGDEEYDNAHALDVEAEPPSIYATVKQCARWADGGPSLTQLNKDAHLVLKHRNDLIHGRNPNISPADVQAAFAAFIRLASGLSASSPLPRHIGGVSARPWWAVWVSKARAVARRVAAHLPSRPRT